MFYNMVCEARISEIITIFGKFDHIYVYLIYTFINIKLFTNLPNIYTNAWTYKLFINTALLYIKIKT